MLLLVSFAAHALPAAAADNEERLLQGQTPIAFSTYDYIEGLVAELPELASRISRDRGQSCFSIFLRQQDSAESKPPEADNRSTGMHND